MTKALGTVLIVIVCLFTLPIAIGLIGGAFGLAFGIIGSILGAIFGGFGALFGGLMSIFDWDGPFHFFECDSFIALALIILVVLAVRSREQRMRNR